MRSRRALLAGALASLLAWSASAQTIVTINNLPPASTLTGAELVPLWQGSGAVQASVSAIVGVGPVKSFNTRTGAITLLSADVTGALTYTPPSFTGIITPTHCAEWSSSGVLEDSGGGCGASAAVSSFNTRTGAVTLTSGDVTTALTFTPLNAASNLSDVVSASTSRTNLGLGSAATLASSAVAQTANNLSDLNSASTSRTNLGVAYGTTAGTVAQGNDSRFAGPTQLSKSTGYTFVLGDAGGQVYHPSGDVTGRAWVIPANASVAYAVGVKIEIVNDCSAGVITLSITSDTLEWFPAGTTGSRSIAACGTATITKLTATEWMITGVGVS